MSSPPPPRAYTFFVATTITIAVGLVACQSDPWGEQPTPPEPQETKQATSSCNASQPAAGSDPSKLAECTGTKGAKGRCAPESSMGGLKGIFETASCKGGEACMPDEIVKEGSNVDLKKCTVLGKEGRCFWSLAKDMVKYYDMLKSSSKECTDGMLCAPCLSPLDNKETGVCSMGGHGASCGAEAEDKAKPETKAGAGKCCEGRGQCVPDSVVAGAGAHLVSKETCEEKSICAANEILGATPSTKCTAALGAVKGICVSKCTMDSPVTGLLQGSCPDGDVCAPCKFLPAAACK